MLVVILLAFLLPASMAALYYSTLSVLALFRQRRTIPDSVANWPMIIVLMPAHDEEEIIARSLLSLQQASYPKELLKIVVVADNCTDRTAAIAREFGAEALDRFNTEFRGKGYAVEFALAQILPTKPDAIFMLDADCLVSEDLFQHLAAAWQSGGHAFQTRVKSYSLAEGDTSYLVAVGAEIDHQVAVGRDGFLGSVPLRGTGMLFSAKLLEQIPWSAFGLTEDAQFDGILRKQGVAVQLVSGGHIYSATPVLNHDFFQQRKRWRHASYEQGVPLWERLLGSKPLVLLHLLLTCAVVLLAVPYLSASFSMFFASWLVAILVLTLAVYVSAMARVGLRLSNLVSLIQAPYIVVRMGWITLAGLWQSTQTWQRTSRTVQ
jgi:1,2-diacylglycerol 3-beta-glucosyltransferase